MSKRRGQGHIYKPTYTDRRTGKKRRQRVWWVKYSIDGQTKYESSGSTKHADAVDLLTRRLRERGRGLSRRDLEKVKYDELAELIRADYKNQGHKSIGRLERSLRHLSAAFSGWRVVDIGEDVIERYKADRKAAKASNATVNRELAALRRMLRLGKRMKLVGEVPAIHLFKEDNARTGFVEEPQHQAMLKELPWHHAAWSEAYYITGWREYTELFSRTWEHVDFDAGWLRLEPNETKNDDGRQFPLIPRLRTLLELQNERKQHIERERGIVIPWVFFQPNGKPIKSFKNAWNSARKRAGLPDFIPHDYRRTAVRNLERAGVPRSTAMAMVGHKTESIYRRYAIQDERSLRDGGERLSEMYGTTSKAPERKVAPFRRSNP